MNTPLIIANVGDIPYELAYDAYRGNSFSPEKRALAAQQGYVNAMEAVAARLEPWATDKNEDAIRADLARYQARYIKLYTALLHAESHHYGPMISGPSNYPTRQMEKRMNTIDKRREEFLEFQDKGLQRMESKYNPNIRRPINSDDEDVLDQLQAKIDRATALQDLMKKANRICRSKKLDTDAKIARLSALEGISEAGAKMLLSPNRYGRVGFAGSELTNKRVKIRATKKRLATLIALEEAGPHADMVAPGLRIYEDRDLNRVCVAFDVKPCKKMREYLKAQAFHWSRDNHAWMRKLTLNAWWAGERVFNNAQFLTEANNEAQEN